MPGPKAMQPPTSIDSDTEGEGEEELGTSMQGVHVSDSEQEPAVGFQEEETSDPDQSQTEIVVISSCSSSISIPRSISPQLIIDEEEWKPTVLHLQEMKSGSRQSFTCRRHHSNRQVR